MASIGYSSHRTRLRWLGGCWAVLLLLSPAGLMGRETRRVTHYKTSGVVLRYFINAPTVVDVGLPTPVTVSSAVTGTGQGTRLTGVTAVVSQGAGGTSAQGPARGSVTKVVIDPDSSLWVGTVHGLSRFDGERWTTFSARDGLADGPIADMDVDQRGHLWLTGSGGITRFDGQNWYRYNVAGSGTSLAVAPNGDVWFVSGHLIYRFDGQAWWKYGHEDGIPEGLVRWISVDTSGTVWADLFPGDFPDHFPQPPTHGYSIISFDGSQWISYEIPERGSIEMVFTDRKNRVWAGGGRGLYVRENGTWSRYDREDFRGAYHIYEDVYSRLWISSGNAFGVLDVTFWTSFSYYEFRADSVVMDDEGHLWIGSKYGGVMKWDSSALPRASPTFTEGENGGQVTVYTTDGVELRPFNAPTVMDVGLPIPVDVPLAVTVTGTGQGTRLTDVEVVVSEGVGGTPAWVLASESVGMLDVDHDGNVWVNTLHGLSRFDGERWTTFDKGPIADMDVDQQGHLWLIDRFGVTRFDGQNWYRYKGMGGTDVAAAPNGDVWFVIGQRIYRFDGQDWWKYGHEDGIPKGRVYRAVVDKSGTLWTDILLEPKHVYALISFDGHQWISYQIPNQDLLPMLFVDSKNRVWVEGLLRLFVRENGTWSMYNRADLSGAYHMYEDRYGRLWISTGDAFGMLDSTSWTTFPIGQPGDYFLVCSVAMDDEGNLWIVFHISSSGSSWDAGVMKWDSSALPPPSPTSTEGESGGGAPQSFDLFQNHPNPFNSETQITFHLPRTERLSLEVFSLTGQPVATLMEGVYPTGRYQIPWDGRDDRGNAAGSGIFFYRLTTETTQSTRTMVLVK